MRKWESIIFVIFITFCGACQEKIDIPPAPSPPAIEERARDFNQAQGELNEDALLALKDWLTSSGGLGTISLMLVSEFLLTDWLGNLSQDEMQDDPQVLENIDLEGWARLNLPCPGGGNLSFNLLLDQSKIAPVVWGNLEECSYPELSLVVSGELNLFMPSFAALPIFSRGDWGENEANGVWIELKGSLRLGELEGQTSQILMIDADKKIVRTLWEDSNQRFVISISEVDWTTITFDDLEALSVTLETDSNTYRCQLTDSMCTQVMSED